MQVHVSAPGALLLATFNDLGLLATAAMNAPAATVGYAADLLDVHMHHVPGVSGDDPARFPVGVACGIDELATVQPEMGQVPAGSARTDRSALANEFERDPGRRPLPSVTQLLDPRDHFGPSRFRLTMRS
jgi:hypothetical protein